MKNRYKIFQIVEGTLYWDMKLYIGDRGFLGHAFSTKEGAEAWASRNLQGWERVDENYTTDE